MRRPLRRARRYPSVRDYDGGREANQLPRMGFDSTEIARAPAKVDLQVAAFDPAKLGERLAQNIQICLLGEIVRSREHEHANALHPLRLLPARHERPCGRRTAKEGD